jgi:hypothetical protein
VTYIPTDLADERTTIADRRPDAYDGPFRASGAWYRRGVKLVRVNADDPDAPPVFEWRTRAEPGVAVGSLVARSYGYELSFTDTTGTAHVRVMPNGQLHLG